MKLTTIIIVVAFAASSCAQDHSSQRRLFRGGGGGRGGGGRGGGSGGGRGGGSGGGRGGGRYDGGGGGRGGMLGKGSCYWGEDGGMPLFDRIQEDCNANAISCEEVGAIDCSSWQTVDGELPLVEGCVEELTEDEREEIKAQMQAKKDKWMAMTDEEKATHKQDKEDARQANAATVLGCSCCRNGGTDNVADLVKGKEGRVAKTLGYQRPREDGGDHGPGHGFGGSNVDMEEKCAAFQDQGKCDIDAEGTIDCTQVNMMKRERKEGRWYKKLYCNCCGEQGGAGNDQGGD